MNKFKDEFGGQRLAVIDNTQTYHDDIIVKVQKISNETKIPEDFSNKLTERRFDS